MKLDVVAGQLVNAARLGDQNAMAMIERVTASAKAGSAKAMAAKVAIARYVKAHPAGPEVAGDCDAMTATHSAQHALMSMVEAQGHGPVGEVAMAASLANGPDIKIDKVQAIAARIKDDYARALFLKTVSSPESLVDIAIQQTSGALRKLAKAGKCLGLAIRIQRVRDPSFPLSSFSPQVGVDFECGPSFRGDCKCSQR